MRKDIDFLKNIAVRVVLDNHIYLNGFLELFTDLLVQCVEEIDDKSLTDLSDIYETVCQIESDNLFYDDDLWIVYRALCLRGEDEMVAYDRLDDLLVTTIKKCF